MILMTWNVNSRTAKLDSQFERCRFHNPDVICLQEITNTTKDKWRSKLQDIGYTVFNSFSETKDSRFYSGRRKYGILIASRVPLSDEKQSIEMQWPERALSVTLQINGLRTQLISVHLPAGRSDSLDGSFTKCECFEGILRSIQSRKDSGCILCGDFNSPQQELDDGRVLCYGGLINKEDQIIPRRSDRSRRQFAAESAVLSHQKEHDLVDAYMTAESVSSERYSYINRNRGNLVTRRYDHVLASTHFVPIKAHYDTTVLQDSLSDHAPLVVDLHKRAQQC
jgi:exodeoxyribonuclease III